MKVILNQIELNELMKQNVGEGGWQSLMQTLQSKVSLGTGEIVLSHTDIEKIPRYAFDYGNGGWENRLKDIFSRHLGPDLGR